MAVIDAKDAYSRSKGDGGVGGRCKGLASV